MVFKWSLICLLVTRSSAAAYLLCLVFSGQTERQLLPKCVTIWLICVMFVATEVVDVVVDVILVVQVCF